MMRTMTHQLLTHLSGMAFREGRLDYLLSNNAYFPNRERTRVDVVALERHLQTAAQQVVDVNLRPNVCYNRDSNSNREK